MMILGHYIRQKSKSPTLSSISPFSYQFRSNILFVVDLIQNAVYCEQEVCFILKFGYYMIKLKSKQLQKVIITILTHFYLHSSEVCKLIYNTYLQLTHHNYYLTLNLFHQMQTQIGSGSSRSTTLQQKRKFNHNEIRRQMLKQKFQKIRTSLIQNLQQSQAMSKEIINLIANLQNSEFYFPKLLDNNYQSDSFISNQVSMQVFSAYKNLMQLYEEQLKQPSEKIKTFLENQQLQFLITQDWEAIYKWEEKYGELIEKSIEALYNNLCKQCYVDIIVDFVLSLTQLLIDGNKVILLRRIFTKQDQFLVGEPEKYYREGLRKRCHDFIINFTATEEENWLAPYLCKISKVIKRSSYFSGIYLNIFLTLSIPITKKFQIFNDFLESMEHNPISIYDYDSIYMKILYVIYGNPPFVTQVSYTSNFKSLDLNYRALLLIEGYLKTLKYKFENFQLSDPYGDDFILILQILSVLEYLFKQQQNLISKVPQMESIMEFIERILKGTGSVPQIKAVRVALKCLNRLYIYPQIMMEIGHKYPALQIQLSKLYNTFCEHLFQQSPPNEQKQLDFKYDISKLKFQCIEQLVKIENSLTGKREKYYTNFIRDKKVKSTLALYWFCHQMSPSKAAIRVRDYCLEILCSGISYLIQPSSQYSQTIQSELQMQNFECPLQDIIISQFFNEHDPSFDKKLETFEIDNQTRVKENRNFFSILTIQIEEMLGDQIYSCNLLAKQTLIHALWKFISRVKFEIDRDCPNSCYEGQNYKNKGVIENPWVWMYRQMKHKYGIFNMLESINNNQSKILQNNDQLKYQIDSVLNAQGSLQILLL